MASQNAATFLRNNKVITIKGEDLMKSVEPLDVHPIIKFEGYFNRDSLKYIDLYQLRGIKTMIRGTLRYKVTCIHDDNLGICKNGGQFQEAGIL